MTRNCILNFPGLHHLLAGELATAERLVDEGRLIANATGNLPVTYAAMLLTAWQGRVHEASELIQAAVQMATGSGRGMLACHRRDRPQARRPGRPRRRGQRGADRPGGPGRPAGQRRHQLPRPAPPGPVRRPRQDPAKLAPPASRHRRPPRRHRPPGQPRLSTGHLHCPPGRRDPSPASTTMTGTQSPDQLQTRSRRRGARET